MKNTWGTQREKWLVTCCIGLSALVPRCWHLAWPMLSHDEAFSWRLTQYPLGEMCQRTGADVHPPLHYVLLQAWVHVWGTTEAGLRSLSVLCGLLGNVFTYLACREGIRFFAEEGKPFCGGAVLSALLLAVNAGQVAAARTARMYGLGIFLAALTAWLLLRALRGDERRWLWWAAYGVALAAFGATHNFALFTALGQAAFALGMVVHKAWQRQPAWPTVKGFAFAAMLALILFSPWLGVLREQTRQVRQSFWVEPVTPALVERTFFSWAAGTEYPGGGIGTWWLVLLGVTVLGTVWWTGPAGWFFLIQAAAPWVGSIGFSLLTGRSILLERCLVFGQVAWAGYWGVLWARLGHWPAQALLAIGLLSTHFHGLVEYLAALPTEPPAIAEAAAFLQAHAEAEETIWVPSPHALNQLRYYLSQAGPRELRVRCRHSPFSQGHVVHIASLRGEDVALDDEEPPGPFWVARAGQEAFDRRGVVLAHYRFGSGRDWFALARLKP